MEKKKRFTQELLNEYLQRDDATLLGDYMKLNSNSIITFKCKCGTEVHKKFKIIVNGIGAYCQKDGSILSKQKASLTNIQKYGVDNPFKSKEIQNKIKQINKQKYGTEHPTQNKDVYNKLKETNKKRYGVENPTMNKEIYEKVKQTTMLHYGVECSLKSEIIIDKCQQSIQQRYGVDNPAKSKEIYKKIKETNIKKYGVELPCQNETVMLKLVATSRERYGTDYPCQNLSVQEKIQANAKKFKEYTMPSGTVRKVQGYEPLALDILLKEYEEEQIITDRKGVGRIPYKHEGKQRYYFPDIKIPHVNKIIEVKSTWTITFENDNIDLKANAAKEEGYDYEIWVFDGKGVRQEIIK